MIIRNLIYILQIELYDIKSFLKFSYTHLAWWKLEKRSKVVWTKKASLIYAVSVVLMLSGIGTAWALFGVQGLVSVFPTVIFTPLFISLAVIILKPLDKFLKKRLIRRAKNLLNTRGKNLVVIGITGSYGKTSTREILTAILSESSRAIELPDNINTDVGIADFILKNSKTFEGNGIFIVEMGAHERGDIKNVCDLVSPEYSILTGINESHLERFGSLENIISAKFELPEATQKSSILNFDDSNILKNYKKFKIKEIAGTSRAAPKR